MEFLWIAIAVIVVVIVATAVIGTLVHCLMKDHITRRGGFGTVFKDHDEWSGGS